MFRPLWAEVLDNELPETGAQQDAGFSRASTGQVNHLEFCGFRILYQPPYRPTSFKHGLMILYEKGIRSSYDFFYLWLCSVSVKMSLVRFSHGYYSQLIGLRVELAGLM